MIEKRGDAGAGGSGVKSVNKECAFVVGGDALGDDMGVIVEEGGGVLTEVTGGLEEVAIFVAETDAVILIVEAEAANVGDESRVINAEEDGIDKVAGSVIGFKNVDFIVVYIGGMARNGGGCPQWFSEDGGLGAHGATTKNDGLFSIGEEGKPWCDN